MSETEKPFTVSDRRHFTPDGRPRAGTEGASAPESPPDPGPPAEARAAAHLPKRQRRRRRPTSPSSSWASAPRPGMLLSGEGRPEGMGTAEALEGAQSIVAILEMLKDKTEGRRSSAEDALLDDLLFQLRMAFVEAARGAGA